MPATNLHWNMAKTKLRIVEELFDKSDLPEFPNTEKAEELLIGIRERYYGKKRKLQIHSNLKLTFTRPRLVNFPNYKT